MNQDPFKRLRELGVKFYKGWYWSMRGKYSQKDFDDFVELVEEPLNQEVERLLAEGYALDTLDEIIKTGKDALEGKRKKARAGIQGLKKED